MHAHLRLTSVSAAELGLFACTDGPSRITAELLDAAREKLQLTAEDDPSNAVELSPTQRGLKIISAFDMPAWNWSEENQSFERSVRPASAWELRLTRPWLTIHALRCSATRRDLGPHTRRRSRPMSRARRST